MKKTSLLLTAILFVITGILAQTPNQFKYQAVLRNADGTIMADESITVDISILKGSAAGTSIFDETYNLTTSAQGIINLNIGSVEDLSVVDFSIDTYFIEITVNGTIMGTSQLLSVPYALNANNAETADYNSLSNLPTLFDGYWNSLTGAVPNISIFNNDAGYLTSELDDNPTNEIQTLSLLNDELSLSEGGGTINIPLNYWTKIGDSLYYSKKVVLGAEVNDDAPPLELVGTTTGSSSPTLLLKRDPTRNNVVEFTSINDDLKVSIGMLGSNQFGYNFLGMGTSFDGITWTNPFKIDLGSPDNSFYINSLGNFGIGTSNPTQLLTLNVGTDQSDGIFFKNEITGDGMKVLFYETSEVLSIRSNYGGVDQPLFNVNRTGYSGHNINNNSVYNPSIIENRHFFKNSADSPNSYSSMSFISRDTWDCTAAINGIAVSPNLMDIAFQNEYGINVVHETLRIKSNGRLEVKQSDVYIENIGSGVIMKSPDGQCWRVTVNNSGSFTSTAISCP